MPNPTKPPLVIAIVNEANPDDPEAPATMRLYLDGEDWSDRVQSGSVSAHMGDRDGTSTVTLTLVTRDLTIRKEFAAPDFNPAFFTYGERYSLPDGGDE